MDQFSLSDQRKLAATFANTMRLLALDEIWTGYMAGNKPVPQTDVAALRALTHEMDQLLVTVGDQMTWFHSFVVQQHGTFDATWPSVMSRPELTENDKRVLAA